MSSSGLEDRSKTEVLQDCVKIFYRVILKDFVLWFQILDGKPAYYLKPIEEIEKLDRKRYESDLSRFEDEDTAKEIAKKVGGKVIKVIEKIRHTITYKEVQQ